MSNQEREKRELSTSSVEDSTDKRQKIEAEGEMPAWARDLCSNVAFTRNTTNEINMTVNELKNDMRKLKDKVEAVENRCDDIDSKGDARDAKFAKLESDFEELKLDNDKTKRDLAKTTDNSLRDSMSFHNIRQTGPEKWPQTKRLLAEFLAKEMAGTDDSERHVEEATSAWIKKIERAHRGKTNVIHVAFESWVYADEVREFFFKKQGKIGNIFILDKYSEHTLERRKLAAAYRDNYRQNHPGVKIWTKYPATLMAKHVGEPKYNSIAAF